MTVHFTGKVRLNPEAPKPATAEAPAAAGQATVSAGDIYNIYFHGPAYQVLESAWREGKTVIGRLANDLPDNHQPPDAPLLMTPRLIELCFQTAGIWEMGVDGEMGLPMAVRSVTSLSNGVIEGPLHAIVSLESDGSFDARVVDGEGRLHVDLIGYRTVRLPGAVTDDALSPLRAAMTEGA